MDDGFEFLTTLCTYKIILVNINHFKGGLKKIKNKRYF